MIELAVLIERCAPQVAPSTIQAIIRTESNFNPLALNVNGSRLASQPRTVAEAVSWSHWLIQNNYSIDMGLMQINSRNLQRLGLTAAEVFDPCRNIQAGARILQSDYERAAKIHGPGNKALLLAISSYNTGSFERGFRNGYVEKVVKHSAAGTTSPTIDLACAISDCAAGSAAPPPLGQPGLFPRIKASILASVDRGRIYILTLLTIVIAVCMHRSLRTDETNGS